MHTVGKNREYRYTRGRIFKCKQTEKVEITDKESSRASSEKVEVTANESCTR